MIACLVLAAALNVNPDFVPDGDAVPGWNMRGPARRVLDEKGVSCVMAEEGSVRSELFPVTGGTVLEVTMKAGRPKYLRRRKYPWTGVAFFKSREEASAKGAQWKFSRPKLEVKTRWVSEKTEKYPVPADAKWCRLTFRCGYVYRCEAKPVKGKTDPK